MRENDTLKPAEAAELMHKNASFVRIGLQQGRFDFGYAVKSGSKWNYYINSKKFFEKTGISPPADNMGGD